MFSVAMPIVAARRKKLERPVMELTARFIGKKRSLRLFPHLDLPKLFVNDSP